MATTTDDTRRASLRRAHEIQMEMADLRRRIRAGGRDHGPELAAKAILAANAAMSFERLLRSVPGIGRVSAEKMLQVARVNPVARVDSRRVVKRQRMLLVDLLLGRS